MGRSEFEADAAGPSEIARRSAQELAAIHATLLGLEEAIAGAGLSDHLRDPAALDALQSLDRAAQAVEGMETFLRRWAATLPDGPAVAIVGLVAGLALRDVSDRLQGLGAAKPPASRSGEVDLF